MESIDIIMATYNGGRYIENQILSLIGQTFKEWTLYVHDDGSTDNTVEIVKKYQEIDSRIYLIIDSCRGLGPAYNFFHILKYSTANYCIFCDQDDIWLENKLEVMNEKINKIDNGGPIALYSNAYVYRECGKLINGKAILAFPANLSELLFLNGGILGCTLMINKKLRDICMNYSEYVCMHDHIICIMAATFGQLVYIDELLMLYRQHSHSVTAETPSGLMMKVKSFFNSDRTVIDRKHYLAVKSFYEKYKEYITEDKKCIFEAYFIYPMSNILFRLKIIYKYKFKIFNMTLILYLKTLIRKPIN